MLKLIDLGLWFWAMAALVGGAVLAFSEWAFVINTTDRVGLSDLLPTLILIVCMSLLCVRQVLRNRWARSAITLGLAAAAVYVTTTLRVVEVSPVNSHLSSLIYCVLPLIVMGLLDAFAGDRHIMRKPAATAEESSEIAEAVTDKAAPRTKAENWDEIEIVEVGSSRSMFKRNSRWRPKGGPRYSLAGE